MPLEYWNPTLFWKIPRRKLALSARAEGGGRRANFSPGQYLLSASSLGQGRLVSLSHVQTHVTDVKIFLTTLKSLCFRRMDGSYCRGTFGLEPTFSSASSMFCLASPKAQTFRTYSSGWPAGFFGSASSWWSVPSRRRWRRPRSLAGRPFPTRSTPKRLCRHLDS